jgi:hypothetical protein
MQAIPGLPPAGSLRLSRCARGAVVKTAVVSMKLCISFLLRHCICGEQFA